MRIFQENMEMRGLKPKAEFKSKTLLKLNSLLIQSLPGNKAESEGVGLSVGGIQT